MIFRLSSISCPSFRFPAVALLGLLLTAITNPARAADESANAPDVDEEEDAPKAKSAPDAPAAPAPAPAQVEEPSAKAVGLVERLPPSAYLAPVIRGLNGGSLWLSSQGAQWPYLPHTTIGVSGYAWLDSNYRHLTDGNTTGRNRTDLTEQGRLVLRVTPTYSQGEWFAQAQAEFVANKQQTVPAQNADVDDIWVRVGKWQKFDLTVGRFEAFEVYHLGMGLDINTDERRGAYSSSSTPPSIYSASFMFYRPDDAGDVAIHAYLSKKLRFEFLSQVGSAGGLNTLGVRPAAILDLGWLKLKYAGEYQVQTAAQVGDKTESKNRGFAGGAQLVFDPYVELGGNAGYALVDNYDNVGNPVGTRSTTTKSFGGFLNARVVPDFLVGLGVNDVKLTDRQYQSGRFGDFSHLQTFAALQYFWASSLMIKFVFGYAKANFDPTFAGAGVPAYSNTSLSGRLRIQLLF